MLLVCDEKYRITMRMYHEIIMIDESKSVLLVFACCICCKNYDLLRNRTSKDGTECPRISYDITLII
jgi:hypothetical protein